MCSPATGKSFDPPTPKHFSFNAPAGACPVCHGLGQKIQAMRARTLLLRLFDDFMSKYDALLEPGTGGTLGATNLTGHPAIALKCGFIGGLPRPLMLTGRLYEEATICRIALAFEQATEWKDRHPSLTA